MLKKERYKYNWLKGEWDQLFTIDTHIVVSNGIINPKTGAPNFSRMPRDSLLAKYCMGNMVGIYSND